jgi:hypothetical protein
MKKFINLIRSFLVVGVLINLIFIFVISIRFFYLIFNLI